MGRKLGAKNVRPSPEQRTEIAVRTAARLDARDTISYELARRNQTPNIVPLTDEIMEEVIIRVASGETVRSVCRDLGVSAALVRQRCLDQRDLYADRMREARSFNADECFEEMLEVARDPEMSPANKRVLIDTLRDIARVGNRAVYGDKVQVDQRQVVINLNGDDLRLT